MPVLNPKDYAYEELDGLLVSSRYTQLQPEDLIQSCNCKACATSRCNCRTAGVPCCDVVCIANVQGRNHLAKTRQINHDVK